MRRLILYLTFQSRLFQKGKKHRYHWMQIFSLYSIVIPYCEGIRIRYKQIIFACDPSHLIQCMHGGRPVCATASTILVDCFDTLKAFLSRPKIYMQLSLNILSLISTRSANIHAVGTCNPQIIFSVFNIKLFLLY